MNTLKNWYEALIVFCDRFRSPLLLAMRLYWGWLLFQAGLGKLENIGAFAKNLSAMNFPFAYQQAYIAATIECVGGFCLMIGFASRLMAIPVIVTLLVAYATAHRTALISIFSKPQEFISQAPFLYILTALLVLAFGPGKLSIDYFIQRVIFKKPE